MYIRNRNKVKALSIILAFIIVLTSFLPARRVTAELTPAPTQPGENITSVPTQPGEDITPVPIQPGENITPFPTQPGESITPVPTYIPVPSLVPSPTVVPTVAPTPAVYRSATLEFMSGYDYIKNSLTGVSTNKAAISVLQKNIKKHGTLYGTGMPLKDYKAAMGYMWEDATEYDKKPTKITVDIKNTMNYKSYVNTLKKLSRYEGVYLYKIGTSAEGRDLYAVEIDVDSDYQKNVIMLTGQIHAREFAGGTYLVKQLVDLVQKAQTDSKTMKLLKKNRFVAVPIINVDGREAIIKDASLWTSKKTGLWKAYVNGTDGGRNFPGIQWGQVLKGAKYKSSIAKKPGYANYPGPSAGSSNETKALMKFLYQYTVVEKADIYLDYHSQGSVIYAGKPWQTATQMQKSRNLRTSVMNILNKGNTKRKYTRVYESSLYGLQGEGSSLTDYAAALAAGARFSPAYGFSTFVYGGKEYPLLQIKNLESTNIKFKAVNKDFATLTIEIGNGNKYLGNTTNTRKLLAKEYTNYHFDKLLEALPGMIK